MGEEYKVQAYNAMEELLSEARLEPKDLVVIGLSTSEVVGKTIGTGSVPEVAKQLFAGFYEPVQKRGLFLAAQCCEHLNRALIVEKEAMEYYRLERVNVKPQPKAGGSFATAAWEAFDQPVAVEYIQAAAGLDVGLTLIGMHLRPVAVPLRLPTKRIGTALVSAARTRPKYVGGSRAIYDDSIG